MIRVSCKILILILIAGCVSRPAVDKSDKSLSVNERYQKAEAFLYHNAKKLIRNGRVRFNWIKDSHYFYYKEELADGGHSFKLFNAETLVESQPFNHRVMLESLKNAGHKSDVAENSNKLPFDSFKVEQFTDGKIEKLSFYIKKQKYQCDLLKNFCAQEPLESPDKIKGEVSPDGKQLAFVRDHNLFVKEVESGKEIQLTDDGASDYYYGQRQEWDHLINLTAPDENAPDGRYLDISWSPDSRYISTIRVDSRKAKSLYLWQPAKTKGSYRAEVHAYTRALPGETDVTVLEPYIFDVSQRKAIRIDIKPLENIQNWASPIWFEDSKTLHLVRKGRAFRDESLIYIDAATGAAKEIFKETAKTYIEPYKSKWRILEKSQLFLRTSEKDGWNHLYLYNASSGELIQQLTQGEWLVRSIVKVDEDKRVIYFTAGGREPNRNPYFQHLYRINFDGTGITLLTPENANHSVTLSDDGKYFIDNYSRVDLEPRFVLRSTEDGKVLKKLVKADISALLATGWQYPEAFTVKARDGKTDLYGVMYRPTHFDRKQSYPVLDSSYSGPHAVRTPHTFMRAALNWENSAFAELGFIVVTIDGLGTASRSKAFQDFSYKNLGDIGAPDHIIAIKELAQRHPQLNLERVGIFGHSAGGYDSAHAILKHGDFYKVAVSSAGNHDHQMAKAWWPELWMGLPQEGEHYVEQSNLAIARQLEGKLLLIHGDMDANVNPSSSFRLAAKLIEANKDFELLILPNLGHSLHSDPYFTRKRWDYFVKHLRQEEPPKNYLIKQVE